MGKKFDVSPYVVNQSTQDGKLKSKDQGLGLDIYSKFGNLGVSKNTNTQSYDGGSELKTKSKNINYGKNFKLGKSSNLTFEANYGKSKNDYTKSTTKGGKITFTKSFSQGGGVAIKGTKFTGVF